MNISGSSSPDISRLHAVHMAARGAAPLAETESAASTPIDGGIELRGLLGQGPRRQSAPSGAREIAMALRDAVAAMPDHAEIDLPGIGEPFRNINDTEGMRADPQLRTTRDCLDFVFGCIRNGSNARELDALAARQDKILHEEGITTKDKLCDLSKAAKRWDLVTGAAHGMASGMAFNMGSAAINEMGAEMLVNSVGGTDVHHMAAVGAGAGFGLSVADVASEPAVKASFLNAYYTRPSDEVLPECLRDARPPLAIAEFRGTLSKGFVMTYGGRNVLRYLMEVTNTKLAGMGVAQTVDKAMDVGGGLIAAGAFRLYRNARDEGVGRTGLHHLLARADLRECVRALNAPAQDQALSVAKRFAAYGVNVVRKLPEGLRNAFATTEGWASHLILTGGFASVLALGAGIRNAVSPASEAASGLSTASGMGQTASTVVDMTTSAIEEVAQGLTADQRAVLAADGVTKLASLPLLYGLYGQAMAFIGLGGADTNWPYPDFTPERLAEAATAEIEARRGSPVVIEMPDILDPRPRSTTI